MKQSERIHHLIELLRTGQYSNHEELLLALKNKGAESTQATLSRDLVRIGVKKVHGSYQLPAQHKASISVQPAGENLIVIKTLPGRAPGIAADIDGITWEGLIGTVAGDDTIFIATANKPNQNSIHLKLLEKFA